MLANVIQGIRFQGEKSAVVTSARGGVCCVSGLLPPGTPFDHPAALDRLNADRLAAERMSLAAASDPMLRLQMAGTAALGGNGGSAGLGPTHAHTHTHAHSHTHLHLHPDHQAALSALGPGPHGHPGQHGGHPPHLHPHHPLHHHGGPPPHHPGTPTPSPLYPHHHHSLPSHLLPGKLALVKSGRLMCCPCACCCRCATGTPPSLQRAKYGGSQLDAIRILPKTGIRSFDTKTHEFTIPHVHVKVRA